jgi:hypothetical protein
MKAISHSFFPSSSFNPITSPTLMSQGELVGSSPLGYENLPLAGDVLYYKLLFAATK